MMSIANPEIHFYTLTIKIPLNVNAILFDFSACLPVPKHIIPPEQLIKSKLNHEKHKKTA